MRGEDEDLGNLHMLGGIGGIDGHVGDVVACEWFDALIDVGSSAGISMETDVAEVGLNKSRLQVRHTDGRTGNIDSQTVGQGFHSSLRGTIDVAAGISGIACNRPPCLAQ